MPRKKASIVEVLPDSEAALVPKRSANLQAMIERMVRERVDEILAAQGAEQLTPDFQPKEIAYEIQRRLNVYERKKWALYFAKWGCRACRKKRVSHASSGHCGTCYLRLNHRLTAVKRDYDRQNPEAEIEQSIDRLTSRFRTAREI